jgi:hypothetical protein
VVILARPDDDMLALHGYKATVESPQIGVIEENHYFRTLHRAERLL